MKYSIVIKDIPEFTPMEINRMGPKQLERLKRDRKKHPRIIKSIISTQQLEKIIKIFNIQQ